MYMYISLDMTGARSCGSLKVRKRFIAVHTCIVCTSTDAYGRLHFGTVRLFMYKYIRIHMIRIYSFLIV